MANSKYIRQVGSCSPPTPPSLPVPSGPNTEDLQRSLVLGTETRARSPVIQVSHVTLRGHPPNPALPVDT